MNRLFKKISVAFAGLAMAVGVGVALGNAKPAVEAKAVDIENNYATVGFETTEGFTAGTTYSNTSIKEDGDDKWGTFYGTASTADKHSGSMCMQMRVYSDSDNLGYTYTICSFAKATKISFWLKAGAGKSASLKVDAYYSLESENTGWTPMVTTKGGGTSYLAQNTSSSWASHTAYMPSDVYGNQNAVYFKIGVASTSTKPTSGNVNFSLDDFVVSYISSEPAVHNVLAAGSYYIAAAADVPSADHGMLNPKLAVESDPVGIAPDFSDNSYAWTISENANGNNGYNISAVVDDTTYYLTATNASSGIAIKSAAPNANEYWTISTDGTDSLGNTRYLLTYTDEGNRYLALYNGETDKLFRYYPSGNNRYMNLIPVDRTLTALALSGELDKTVYTVGESFAADGTAKVKGTYSNNYGGSSVYLDVTDSVTWDPATFSSANPSTEVHAKIGLVSSDDAFEVSVVNDIVSVVGVDLIEANIPFQYSDIGSQSTSQLHWTISGEGGEAPSDTAVTFSSSSASVATVSESGLVTCKGVGNATITITTHDGDFTDTCTVTVADHVGTHTRLSSVDELWEGRSIVIAAATANFMMPHWSAGNNIAAAETTTNVSRTSLTPGSADTWTIGIYGNYFTFSYQVEETTYYLHENVSGSPYLNAVTEFDLDCLWSVSINNETGVATIGAYSQISSKDYYLELNASSSPKRFACYAGTQTKLALYAIAGDPTDEDVLNSFQYKYLHLKDYGTGSDKLPYNANACYGTDGSDGFYAFAKGAYNNLSNARKLLFCTENAYKAGYDRLVAWATACGDAIDPLNNYSLGSGHVAPSISSTSSNDNNAIIIAVIATLGALTVGGLFFVSRRRKER